MKQNRQRSWRYTRIDISVSTNERQSDPIGDSRECQNDPQRRPADMIQDQGSAHVSADRRFRSTLHRIVAGLICSKERLLAEGRIAGQNSHVTAKVVVVTEGKNIHIRLVGAPSEKAEDTPLR